MSKKVYSFSYELANGEQVLCGIKTCMYPERTKVWKRLMFLVINKEDIVSIKYTIE